LRHSLSLRDSIARCTTPVSHLCVRGSNKASRQQGNKATRQHTQHGNTCNTATEQQGNTESHNRYPCNKESHYRHPCITATRQQGNRARRRQGISQSISLQHSSRATRQQSNKATRNLTITTLAMLTIDTRASHSKPVHHCLPQPDTV